MIWTVQGVRRLMCGLRGHETRSCTSNGIDYRCNASAVGTRRWVGRSETTDHTAGRRLTRLRLSPAVP